MIEERKSPSVVGEQQSSEEFNDRIDPDEKRSFFNMIQNLEGSNWEYS